MPGPDYYISDLHLSPDTAALNHLFDVFLERDAKGANSLTIGGDFFHMFYGRKQLREPFYKATCEQLRALADTGTSVDFVIGNRDFMLWRDIGRFGVKGHKSWCERVIGANGGTGERVAMHHGDTFCLDDKAYLRFRKIMHFIPWYHMGLVLPQWVGVTTGNIFRSQSKKRHARNAHLPPKPPAYWDIKDEAVLPFIVQTGCDTLVCGHIHQPQERRYEIKKPDGTMRAARLLVMGDWRQDGAVIARAQAGESLELVKLTLDGIEAWPHEVKLVKRETGNVRQET